MKTYRSKYSVVKTILALSAVFAVYGGVFHRSAPAGQTVLSRTATSRPAIQIAGDGQETHGGKNGTPPKRSV